MRPYLNGVSGKNKSDITTLAGGLNMCNSKAFINDNQMAWMMNLAIYDLPVLSTRSDRLSVAWFMEDTNLYATGKVIKMFSSSSKRLYTIEEQEEESHVYWLQVESNNNLKKVYMGKVAKATRYFVCECRDAEHVYIYISTNTARYKLIEGTEGIEELKDVSTGVIVCHKNRLFVGNGTSLKFSSLREYEDFLTDIEISYVDGDTDDFTINSGIFINEVKRLETGTGNYKITAENNSGTVETKVSLYNKAKSFWETVDIATTAYTVGDVNIGEEKSILVVVGTDSTAGEINITNAKGDIVAMISYDDKLIIFCERSWHVLYGDSPNPEVNQFSLVDMDDQIGCISSETVTICNRLLYWIDHNMAVYQYNGASIAKVSEPFGDDGYGGIKNLEITQSRKKNIVMSSYDNYVHIVVTTSPFYDALNETMIVYDTNTRVWWLEDGEFSALCKWETDGDVPFSNKSDYLLGAKYNGDIQILNMHTKGGNDVEFNVETRGFDTNDIRYNFETKTWLLGAVKNTKTLTDVWFEAAANADVYVCDYFTKQDSSSRCLKLGNLKMPNHYDMLEQHYYAHEGEERQRLIVPRMYVQKVNAFSLKVAGKGAAEFFMLEKNWRIK